MKPTKPTKAGKAGRVTKITHINRTKWGWHYRTLVALRERLIESRKDLLTFAATPLEASNTEMADAATDEFNHDLALSQISSEQDALYEIDEALARIKNGTYGVCDLTGQTIPGERLRAVPWTRFAKETEAQLERDGAVHGRKLGILGSVRGVPTGDLAESESEENKQLPEADDETLSESTRPRKLPRRSS